jgi:hypothetical protein
LRNLFLIEIDVKLVTRVVHFEIPAAGEDKEPGINGAIMEKGNFKTTVNTVGVSSVDEVLEKIEEAGGKVIMPNGAVIWAGIHCLRYRHPARQRPVHCERRRGPFD